MKSEKSQATTLKLLDLISKYTPSSAATTRASLLHEMHKSLLEHTIRELPEILTSIYTQSFALQLQDLSQSNEPYSYFCLRLLDHFSLVPSLRRKLVSMGVVKTCLNLLKSIEYEKCLSSLSLLTGLIGTSEVYLEFLENQGVKLLYNLLQTKEVEFIFYILRIFDWLLNSPKIYRDSLLHMGIVDALKFNIKNNPELQKSTVLFGQAKRIKDEIEILEQFYFNKAFNS